MTFPSDAFRNISSRLTGAAPARRNALALAVGLGLLTTTLSACSSVPPLTKERVSRSEASVQQAQQAVGRSEAGAIELQQATDKLNAAKAALAKDRLAMAKSQSASARKAADEVLASVETLRKETERTSPTPL